MGESDARLFPPSFRLGFNSSRELTVPGHNQHTVKEVRGFVQAYRTAVYLLVNRLELLDVFGVRYGYAEIL